MKIRTMVLIVAGLLVIGACGDGGEEGATDTTAPTATEAPTTAAPTTTEAPATTSAGETTTTAGEETVDGVQSVDTDLGTILVDPEGFTLYLFTNDTGGESSCYDSCAATWPPVPGDTAIGSDLDAAMFGTTARTDGSEQLTANGQPLYRYAPDANPGDTNGQGVGGVWFVVGADGSMIEAALDNAPTGDDLDY